MSPLIGVHDRIEQARDTSGRPSHLPWASFTEFFRSRVYDPRLVTRNFLTYCDDDRGLRRTYTYAELGTVVERMADVLHTSFSLTRGDRVATVLFNHDLTLLTYFAAWTLGIAVVPAPVAELMVPRAASMRQSRASCSSSCCSFALCCTNSVTSSRRVNSASPPRPSGR